MDQQLKDNKGVILSEAVCRKHFLKSWLAVRNKKYSIFIILNVETDQTVFDCFSDAMRCAKGTAVTFYSLTLFTLSFLVFLQAVANSFSASMVLNIQHNSLTLLI